MRGQAPESAPTEAPKEEAKGKKAKGKAKEESKGPVAGVLALPAEIAPYKVVLLPLDARVAAQYADLLASLREKLTADGLQYKVDESGASIGRRCTLALAQSSPPASIGRRCTLALTQSSPPASP